MHDFLNTCILYYILMNMSIPKMNKNAVFIKNFTFREAEHIVPRQAVYRVKHIASAQADISCDLRRGRNT